MKNIVTERIGFNALIHNLGVGIFRFTPKLSKNIIFADDLFCNILGYKQKEIAKLSMPVLFEDKGQWQVFWKALTKEGAVTFEEVEMRTKDKQLVSCRLSMVVVKDERDRISYVDGALLDISGHKRTEEELQESKEIFQTVFNNSAAAIIVTDKEEKIIAWNPFAESMLESSRQDLFNCPVKKLYPPKEFKRIRALRVRQQGMVSNFETQVCKSNGSVLDVNMSISFIRDSEGHITGSIGILQDITKQKMAEVKIRESENKARVILENSPVAITLLDEKGQIVSWNRYTEELLGMNKGDLYLKPIQMIYPQEEWEKIQKVGIRREGSKHHLETKVIRKEGKVIDVDLSVNILRDSNKKIVGSVGIMQDITQQKRTQDMLLKAKIAAEDTSKAKSLFLANMSHEVRTPMNTIMGMIDLTLDTDLTKEQKDNLSTVKDAADILLSLLNDILDLSRVEAGKIHLEQIEINIQNIVKSVCKGLSVLAKNKNLELVWQMGDAVPEMVLGDPIRLRQIMVNLINNAIKFTFKGKIAIKVKLNKMLDDNNCELLFAVSDEGVGIRQDKLKEIFEVFAQADTSTTRRFGGTGLGLSISKKLVEMMGGRIWAESVEFKGSTFFFTGQFKIVQKEDIPQALKEKSIEAELLAQLPKRDLKNLSILLAEDNIVNQKMAVRMLEKRGWSVTTADNGQQVLDSVEQGVFDLILMDALMPVMDGYEATRRIRDKEKKTGERIPIIALTARAMSGDKQKCLAAGMDGYVPKPIDRQKLYETIEKLFIKERSSNA